MHITWHGHYTVKIITQGTVIVLDPHSSAVNSVPFKSKADIAALTNPKSSDTSYISGLQSQTTVINSPGEYAINDTTLYARGWHDAEGIERSIQRWHIEDATILHLGALNRKLEDTELQELEQTNIDILLLPIGGGTGLNTQSAIEVLSIIEPSIVIPINYKTNRSTNKLGSVNEFAKEMATDPTKKEQKLSITGKKIDRENLTTVILST